MSDVKLNNVRKKYDNLEVIHGVDLNISNGEFCVFVGPSGCGKSTLLRMIAGLEEVTEGSIEIAARDVTRIDPADRGIAMVFQSYALYPHMTVRENMSFGLRIRKMDKTEIENRVKQAADILQIHAPDSQGQACRSGLDSEAWFVSSQIDADLRIALRYPE